MKLDRDLSFLKEVSKNDRKLISGGAIVTGSSTGNGESSSSSSSSSFSFVTTRDGVTTGRTSGRTSSTIIVNGKVIKSEDKSFDFPINSPFSFSIESRVD